MIKHLGKLFGFFFILMSHPVSGQDEFFREISLEKALIENEKWECMGEANWKHLYNEPRWRRWGVSFAGARKIKQFRLLGGANGYYTFNRKITNFFEVRPCIAVEFNVSLFAGITLKQRLKSEWRFFFNEEEPTREDYRRLRYQLGFDIPLSGEREPFWKIRPSFEWYFIRDPVSFERFSNERDYGLLLSKNLKNDHALSFGYKIEEFYNIETERGNGHIILVGYSF